MTSLPATEVILRKFETPDEVRQFPKGTFELVKIGGMTIGPASYEPGWRWSVDVGPGVGSTSSAPRNTRSSATGAFARRDPRTDRIAREPAP
jgi:hypothetical protein